MRVVTGAQPERKTAIEFSDREIAVIHRGLYRDYPTDDSIHEDNDTLFGEFDKLMKNLNITALSFPK